MRYFERRGRGHEQQDGDVDECRREPDPTVPAAAVKAVNETAPPVEE